MHGVSETRELECYMTSSAKVFFSEGDCWLRYRRPSLTPCVEHKKIDVIRAEFRDAVVSRYMPLP